MPQLPSVMVLLVMVLLPALPPSLMDRPVEAPLTLLDCTTFPVLGPSFGVNITPKFPPLILLLVIFRPVPESASIPAFEAPEIVLDETDMEAHCSRKIPLVPPV